MAESKPTITAADVRAALRRYFRHPEYGIVFEVAKGTGFTANRHLDAMAMDTWPSRGLALHGIEIKVSKSDLAAELRNPAKAGEIADFCNYFWIAAPKGVADIEKLPMSWGLLELGEKDLVPKKQPKQHPAPKEPTRLLLAAIFRAAGRPVSDDLSAALAKHKVELLDWHAKTLAEAIEHRDSQYRGDAEAYRKLRNDLGVRWMEPLEAVVTRYKAAAAIDGLEHLLSNARAAAENVAALLKNANPIKAVDDADGP